VREGLVKAGFHMLLVGVVREALAMAAAAAAEPAREEETGSATETGSAMAREPGPAWALASAA